MQKGLIGKKIGMTQVFDDKGNVVGSCIAWHDLKDKATVASLHWLVVSPKHQGKHIWHRAGHLL